MNVEGPEQTIPIEATPAESYAQVDPSPAPIEESASASTDAYADWVELVERIRDGETDGMAELYQLFSRGIRFYLCRQLGPAGIWTTRSTIRSLSWCSRSERVNCGNRPG